MFFDMNIGRAENSHVATGACPYSICKPLCDDVCLYSSAVGTGDDDLSRRIAPLTADFGPVPAPHRPSSPVTALEDGEVNSGDYYTAYSSDKV
jgi:hypothetical protein